jgi:DNA-binding MarR family transcriptional regulator
MQTISVETPVICHKSQVNVDCNPLCPRSAPVVLSMVGAAHRHRSGVSIGVGLSTVKLSDLPEILFELSNRLALDAATEAGLAELPPSELETLRIISIAPGRGVAYLCERTKIRQANMSATIRSLVARGLVAKLPDERDRRAVRLYATGQASNDLAALRAVWNSRLVRSLDKAGIDRDERRRLISVLDGMRNTL